eukprot:223787-Amphidinium_carterae.2
MTNWSKPCLLPSFLQYYKFMWCSLDPVYASCTHTVKLSWGTSNMTNITATWRICGAIYAKASVLEWQCTELE